MQIVDPDGVPVNDAANYPLSPEAAIAWCVEHDVRVEFSHYPDVHVYMDCDGRLAVQPTFIDAVEELQREEVLNANH